MINKPPPKPIEFYLNILGLSIKKDFPDLFKHGPYDIIEKKIKKTRKIIHKAYRKKAFDNHPDRGGDPEKMKAINDAYKILTDNIKISYVRIPVNIKGMFQNNTSAASTSNDYWW